MSYPDKEGQEAGAGQSPGATAEDEAAHATTTTDPTAAPAAAANTYTPLIWARRTRAGREQMRIRDYSAAQESFIAALDATAGRPPHDVRVQTSLDNLVRLARRLQTAGQYPEAGEVLAVLLEQRGMQRLPGSASLTPVLIAQGHYLGAQGQTESAIEIFELALDLEDAELRTDTRSSLETKRALGKAYMRAGRLDEASSLLVAVAREVEERAGSESLPTAAALASLAELQQLQGDFEAAERNFRRALEIQSTAVPEGFEVAYTSNSLAWLYLERGRFLESLGLARQAVEIFEDLRIEGAVLAAALDTLATAETRLEKYTDAEENYRRAISEFDKADPASQRRLIAVLENYAVMLRAVDRPSEAQAIDARVALERP
jgi:tetratricopeptide (TPR) repeat protein